MICKWNENTDITFEVNEISHPTVQGSVVTKFSINDFIKNVKASKKKYRCTVFSNINIEDGDRIKIMDFDRLVTSQDPKTKKLMQFIEVVPEVIKKKDYKPKERVQDSPYE